MNEEYMTDAEFNEVLNEFLLQPTAKLAEKYQLKFGGDRNG